MLRVEAGKSCFEKLHVISDFLIRRSRYDFILRGFELHPGFEQQTGTFLRSFDFAVYCHE